MHPDIERIVLNEEEIRKRVQEIGLEIVRDYAGRKPIFVSILKGSVVFLSDLLRQVHIDCVVDFICLASYSGASSTGAVRLLLDLREDLEDRDVLVVEDIVDTGLTLSYLMQNLQARSPRSLEICAFLDKPDCRKVPVQPKYVGFKIPNDFVVGYGLDYSENYRNLPYVAVLKKSLIQTRE